MVGEPAPTEISLLLFFPFFSNCEQSTVNCQQSTVNSSQLLFSNFNLVVGADAVSGCGHFFSNALGQRNVTQFGTNFLTFIQSVFNHRLDGFSFVGVSNFFGYEHPSVGDNWIGCSAFWIYDKGPQIFWQWSCC